MNKNEEQAGAFVAGESAENDLPCDDAPESTKPTLSHSRMSTLFKCGWIYKFRYEDGLIIPPKAAMIIGSGVDDAVNDDLTAKKDTGDLLEIEAVRDRAAESVKARWSMDGVLLSDEEAERGKHKVKGEAIDMAVSLAELHHNELAPEMEPTAIQRAFRVNVDGIGHDLIGFIDIQEEREIQDTPDDEPQRVSILRDTKTTARSPSMDRKTGRYPDVDQSMQLSLYALAAKVNDGMIPDKLSYDYLVKTKTPKTVVAETTRTDDDLRVALERMHVASEIINAGVFTPADPNSWICSEKWCGYFDRCPFGAGHKKSFGGFKA